ncbi:hypothetical protein [Candidatus Thiodictyon syntrophicum]|jgi:hypothetical protein|uniref:Uncharacterized protein n=1 Tax=Candidatus Thiodictyon syntrophicum TaxID=1166950 RepID=A0A2K8U6K0_9GAMM|nr:hypothetical protein [Candidatus Thiodictyon syntrophicum]AUB81228.1 hypothetical protein THSYN_09870 [Candidatus Thiodictyon syntrophicum]
MFNAERRRQLSDLDAMLTRWGESGGACDKAPAVAVTWRREYDALKALIERKRRGLAGLLVGAAELAAIKERFDGLDQAIGLIRAVDNLCQSIRRRLTASTPVPVGPFLPLGQEIERKRAAILAAIDESARIDSIDAGVLRQTRSALDTLSRRALCLEGLVVVLQQALEHRARLQNMGRDEFDVLFSARFAAGVPEDPDACARLRDEVQGILSEATPMATGMPPSGPTAASAPATSGLSAAATTSPAAPPPPSPPVTEALAAGAPSDILDQLYSWVIEVKVPAVRRPADETAFTDINVRFRQSRDQTDRVAALNEADALLSGFRERARTWRDQRLGELRQVWTEVADLLLDTTATNQAVAERLAPEIDRLAMAAIDPAHEFRNWTEGYDSARRTLCETLDGSRRFDGWWKDRLDRLGACQARLQAEMAPLIDGLQSRAPLPDCCTQLARADQFLGELRTRTGAQAILADLPRVVEQQHELDRCERWLTAIKERCEALASLPAATGVDAGTPADWREPLQAPGNDNQQQRKPLEEWEAALAGWEGQWRIALETLAERLESRAKAHAKLRSQPTTVPPLPTDTDAPTLLRYAGQARESARVLYNEAQAEALDCAEKMHHRLTQASAGNLGHGEPASELVLKLRNPAASQPRDTANLTDLIAAVEERHQALAQAREVMKELPTQEEQLDQRIATARRTWLAVKPRFDRAPVADGVALRADFLRGRVEDLLDGTALAVADLPVREQQLARANKLIKRIEDQVKRKDLARLDQLLTQLQAFRGSEDANQLLATVQQQIATGAEEPAKLLHKIDRFLQQHP